MTKQQQGHVSLQEEANRGLGDCRLEDDSLTPCGYHRDRAHSRPLRLDSPMIEDDNDRTEGRLPSNEDTKELARCLCDPAWAAWPPAGGWYLVKEQREWLHEKVLSYLRHSGRTSLRVLEAGSASHVHHVTYLSILQEVLDAADVDVTLEVLTVDQCLLPVLAIETLRSGARETPLSVQGYDVELHPKLFELIDRTGVLEDPRITGRTLNHDLTDTSWLPEQGEFDLVTEHFISAVLGNFELLGDFRTTYARLLRPGGWLLCACGLTKRTHGDEYKRFIELNERNGLELREIEGVWDPFGMRRDEIEVLLEDQPLQTYLDNHLFRFERVA